MEWTTVYVGSVTHAMRGKRLLQQHGFSVHIQRSTNPDETIGCGYSLLIKGEGKRAIALLRQAGIRILKVLNGGNLP